jgi:FXSXX-COOH protein
LIAQRSCHAVHSPCTQAVGSYPKLGRAAVAAHRIHPAAVVSFFQLRVLTVVIQQLEVVQKRYNLISPPASGPSLAGEYGRMAGAMRSNDGASGVSSAVVDVRSLSLADMLALSTNTLDQAVARVLPDSPVAVAAFNSAI